MKASKLMEVRRVIAEATKARDAGATRYCMGAAWRKSQGARHGCGRSDGRRRQGARHGDLHDARACSTSGQAQQLKEAGLDYYNHNIDTSERYYNEIISTRTFADRLDTLANVRDSGIKVCCGGIVGMGEEPVARIDMLVTWPICRNIPKAFRSTCLSRSRARPACRRQADRADRIRARDRAGAHHDAEIACPTFGRPHRDDR
ncbi:radical SAM protein [Mesorhizobium calcicola]|uniref:Radical SAM protein n=1 Tax=Mesorhizobium calcicola TaxID=1300310 RepID=A0ABW4W7A2_9HYPH